MARSPYCKIFVVLLLCLCAWSYASATTVVVFISPDWIIVAADSKPSVYGNPGMRPTEQSKVDRKVFLVGDGQFIITHTGLGKFIFKPTLGESTVIFQFADSVAAIRKKVTARMTVHELAKVAQAEISPKIFKAFDINYSHGWIDPASTPSMEDCLIAGFENGSPMVYDVSFPIDWSRGGVWSDLELVQPSRENVGRGEYKTYGIDTAIREIAVPHTQANKIATEIAPKEMAALSSRHGLTFQQTVTLAKTMIEVESKLTPNHVGLPAVVEIIRPRHHRR